MSRHLPIPADAQQLRACPPCEVSATGKDSTPIPRGRWFRCPRCHEVYGAEPWWMGLADAARRYWARRVS